MDASDCLARRLPPKLTAGDRLAQGTFVHNIESGKVSFRYPKSPEFGRGVKGWKLNWTTEGSPVLSVNQRECIACACCSLLLDQYPDKHDAILQLNLPAIGSLINVRLVAVYCPVDEPQYQNECHFELVVDDSVTWDCLQASLKRVLQSPSNGADGWPSSLNGHADRETARTRMGEHDEAYSVELDPCE